MATRATKATGVPPAARADDAVETVRGFLAALERLDIDAALDYAASDIVYQNVPFPPARGIAAVGRQLRVMERLGSGFEVRMHNIAAEGEVVLTERTDVIEVGRVSAAFWVCGTFEVRDGKIVLWRDRFDFADVLVATLRGVAGAVASLLRGRART